MCQSCPPRGLWKENHLSIAIPTPASSLNIQVNSIKASVATHVVRCCTCVATQEEHLEILNTYVNKEQCVKTKIVTWLYVSCISVSTEGNESEKTYFPIYMFQLVFNKFQSTFPLDTLSFFQFINIPVYKHYYKKKNAMLRK